MGLDIYFAEDIRNALLAADEASTSTARACGSGSNPVASRAFLEGYRAALVTVAIAFGLSPAILSHPRQAFLEGAQGQGGDGQGQRLEGDGEDVVHIVPDRIWE